MPWSQQKMHQLWRGNLKRMPRDAESPEGKTEKNAERGWIFVWTAQSDKVAIAAETPRTAAARQPGGPGSPGSKVAMIHWEERFYTPYHLLEVTFETANVLELRQKLLYTTPSGWRWFIESVFRYTDLASCMHTDSVDTSRSGRVLSFLSQPQGQRHRCAQ